MLGTFIILMKDKSTSGSWKKMENIIKVGISAWPIVFAAVVAQVFKAFATWKVERGIKLIQLEQLIGSNSFGNAIKQPLMLRQVDTISLVLLLTWCLSPFGSQALQRSFYKDTAMTYTNTTLKYIDQTGYNRIFAIDWEEHVGNTTHAANNQLTAVEWLSSIAPTDWETNEVSGYMDGYNHPIMIDPNTNATVAMMGVPIVLQDSRLLNSTSLLATSEGSFAPWEELRFSLNSSFFNVSCGDFSVAARTDIPDLANLTFSASGTLGMEFVAVDDSSRINYVRVASANGAVTNVSTVTNATQFSYVECNLDQIFTTTDIWCLRSPPGKSGVKSLPEVYCVAYYATEIPADEVTDSMYTNLENFADDWVYLGTPSKPTSLNFVTPTELYIQNGSADWSVSSMNLTATNIEYDLRAEDPDYNGYPFWFTFRSLLNTWVGIGYCPECMSIQDPDTLGFADDDVQAQYLTAPSELISAIDQVYFLSVPWISCFMICTGILLAAGVISIIVESMTVAPDTLGYVSTVARNSRYLHVKQTSGAMSGAERARKLAETKVMMQDVKSRADVGKIALGLKHENAVKLQADRLYR
ncbi:hypothetical protein BX600DRAFT_89308 [Xylariales sp. PMI_506]|nr:hypothetical protein BX600DRAFT_89308 [Xylariales sp. PMI_506]